MMTEPTDPHETKIYRLGVVAGLDIAEDICHSIMSGIVDTKGDSAKFECQIEIRAVKTVLREICRRRQQC